jgi:hypothetical protein
VPQSCGRHTPAQGTQLTGALAVFNEAARALGQQLLIFGVKTNTISTQLLTRFCKSR